MYLSCTYLQIGRVKWFNTERGFGFIQSLDQSMEYFVHQRNINGNNGDLNGLKDGQLVSFDIQSSDPKGLKAINVSPLSESTSPSLTASNASSNRGTNRGGPPSTAKYLCYSCGEIGHLSKNCPKASNTGNQSVSTAGSHHGPSPGGASLTSSRGGGFLSLVLPSSPQAVLQLC